jgi:trans-aconitate methyltransferase
VTSPFDAGPVDTSVPNVARIYNALLGGKDNYHADRLAAERILALEPGSRAVAQQNRDFLRRVVRYLVSEAGVRQFIDIGSGLPTMDNVHEVAQGIAPESRIVYIDRDPVVLSHARALLTSNPLGSCAYLDADLRDVDAILEGAARTLDLGKPVAIMLLAILHFVPDEADPQDVVRRLMAGAAPGSYLAVSHATSDQFRDEANKGKLNDVYSGTSSGGVTPRSFAAIERLFSGLELVEPGLVDINAWHPVAAPAGPPAQTLFYAGTARKP